VIRVMLVDAMALVRSGIRMVLLSAGDFEVVGEAATVDDAHRLAHDLRPDILLLDRSIEGTLPAVKAIKGTIPTCDVVVLSNSFNQADAGRVFEEGATGYVCKDIPANILLSTLRAIRAPGEARSVVASLEGATFHSHPSPPRRQQPLPVTELTPRERDILLELSTGSTDSEIAKRLNVHEGTIKTHVRHILRKLGVRNRTAAIAHALRERLIK